MDEEALSFERACAMVDDFTEHIRHDQGVMPAMYVHGIEQTMAAIRDHLTAMDCDPLDKNQLRAAFCGSMMFMLLQANVSPINPQCIVLLDAMKTAGTTDLVAKATWESLMQRLEPKRTGRIKRALKGLRIY